MIKTILALAVTAAAYLIASDAHAATTTLDLDEPVMVRGSAGAYIVTDAPRHWRIDDTFVTFGATVGNPQGARRSIVSVDCTNPRAAHVGNPQSSAPPVYVPLARGTLSRQVAEHICANINFNDRPMQAY